MGAPSTTREEYRSYARERAIAVREYEKKRVAAELAALRERVPEELRHVYAIINYNDKWQERSRYQSNSLRQLWANAGVGLDVVRYMIDTGNAKKTFYGWMKIVPADVAGG